VGYAPGKLEQAVEKALQLREQGKVVELAAAPNAKQEAEAMQKERGYQELVYLA